MGIKVNVWDVLKELNQRDTENGSRLLGVCNTVVEMKASKAGDLITIGTPVGTLQRVSSGETRAVLMLIDAKEFDNLTK